MALYVSVMMTTLIVSLLGLAGIAVMRIERLESTATNDILIARMNAESALEHALVVLANDDAWRTSYTSGVETTPQSLGWDPNDTISWIVADSDGDLTDTDTSLTLQGIGRVGDTVQVVEVELEIGVLTCLESSIHTADAIVISSATLTNDHIASSNNQVVAYGTSSISGDVEAVNSIGGTGYSGSTTNGVESRSMPGSDVFDYYLANGTSISYDSLPSGKIEKSLISPEHKPFRINESARDIRH